MTTVTSGQTSSNLVVSSGASNLLTVNSGGTVISTTILNGGSAVISGVDSAATISAGGYEMVVGSAFGDVIYGTQVVSAAAAVVSGETVMSGGTVDLNKASATISAITVESGGFLVISANAPAYNTVLSGGTVELESAKASVSGTLSMTGSATIKETTTISSGYGEAAVIGGFAAGDAIYLTTITSGANLASAISGTNTVVSVTSGSVIETFVFSGTAYSAGSFTLTNGTISGAMITANGWTPPAPITVSSGVTSTGLIVSSGSPLSVLAGGSAVNATVLSGGSATIAGSDSGLTVSAGGNVLVTGSETSATISAGGNENMSGTATGDVIYGTQLVSAATAAVTGETVSGGGVIELFLKGAQANGTEVLSGGTLAISGNAYASNTVLSGGTVVLESGKASLDGTLTFSGAGGILNDASVVTSPGSGFGMGATIQGFGAGDVIELTAIGSGATLSVTTAGGNDVVLISGGSTESGTVQSVTFSGTGWTSSGSFVLSAVSSGGSVIGAEIVYSAGELIVGSGATSNGAVVNSGVSLVVLNGGSASDAYVRAGGSASVAGSESGATVAAGATMTVTGSAGGDVISGTEILSGTASNETITAGGAIQLATSGAELTGSLTFNGSGTLVVGAVAASGAGDQAMISGFGAGDTIDVTVLGVDTGVTSAVSGGNTVVTVTGDGGSESFVFAGAGYGVAGDFVLSGNDLVFSANTGNTAYVSSGQAAPADYVVSGGYVLDVLAGGSAAGVAVQAGGEIIVAGSATGTQALAGGTELVTGSVTGETIYGDQIVSGTASNDTIEAGGSATISGSDNGDTVYGAETVSGSVTNVTVSGGAVTLVAGGSVSGVNFAGGSLSVASGATVEGVISGIASGDAIDLQNIGSGASITSANVDGNTEITITGGSTETGTESFIFAGEGAAYALSTDAAGTGEDLTLTTVIPQITSFTAGDIVIGLIGDDNDSGYYSDNQAAPIVLEEIDPTTGAIVGEMTLPQETEVVNGVTEYEISGEYGSSSEGTIQLAANGQSIVIAGYGVNAAYYNANTGQYGSAALAQTTSLTDQTTYTPVARVVADISYNGIVDTSTALYNIYNTNNPRSVTTVNGTVFYLSGQGVKGDTTQGVFEANDGASSATAIDTVSDTRDVEIYNGQLYISADSTQGLDGIYSLGDLPTGSQTPTVLNGINTSITLTAAEENSVNASAVGTTVDLDPENFFFANGTTLYIADGGQPKDGTSGDGGLQKWTLNTTTGVWHLDYTLSAGLDLVDNANVSNDTDGSAGIIGLTGVLNANGTVTFYTTNETIADLDQTDVYTITDNVNATTAAAGEAFSVVYTAGADTNVRGVVEAPSAPVSIEITSGETTSAGLVISGGSTLTVDAGGAASAAMILSGGSAVISGTDTGSTIVEGGSEIVLGSASEDAVYGTQFVGGSVSNEAADYGGLIDLAAGAVASDISVNAGGTLEVLSGSSVTGVTLNGGTIELGSGAAVAQVITGFTAGEAIDFVTLGSGAVLSTAVVDGNTLVTVTSGGVSQSITLEGQFAAGSLGLIADGAGGVDVEILPQTLSGTETISSGVLGDDITVASGAVLTVAPGGVISGITVLSGGYLVVSGTDPNVVIETGGSATIYGTATDYLVEGTMTVFGAVSGVTISNGSLVLESGASAANIVVEGGDVTDAAAGLAGTLTFTSWGDVTENGTVASGQLLISGFTTADEIDLVSIGTGATLASTTSDDNTIVTVSGGSTQTGSDSFTFAGTGTVFDLVSDYSGTGEDLAVSGLPSSVTSIYSGESTPSGYVVSGGKVLDVLSGGVANGVTILAGGSANLGGTDSGLMISSGGNATVTGMETSAVISAGGNETVSGTAVGDAIYGTQLVSAGTAVVTSETVFGGGNLDLFLKGGVASATIVQSGGALNISGNATATNTLLSGGVLDLQSPKATLVGSVYFAAGGSMLEETSLISAGYGDLAVISGFNASDVIDLTAVGSGAMLSAVNSGGNTVLTVTAGSTEIGAGKTSQGFIMAGTGVQYALETDASKTGEEIVAVVATPTITKITGSLVDGATLTATGTGTAGDAITLSNGATGTVGSDGSFSISFSAVEGVDSLTAMQSDAAGDVSSASAAYGFDVAPVAPTINSTVTQALSGGAIVVTGTGENGETVTLFADGGTTVVGSAVVVGGSYSITTGVGFSEGTHSLTATETDSAGVTSTAGSASVLVDAGPVAAAGSVTVGHGQSVDLSSLIDRLVTPGISGDTISIVTVSGGDAALSNGVWTDVAGASGSQTISYEVTDQHGTTASNQITVTADPGPETVSGSVTEGYNRTVNLTSVIEGLVTPGIAGDQISIIAVSGGDAAMSDGTVTDVTGVSGSQTITYEVSDQYGDTATGTLTVTADPGPKATAGKVTEGHSQSVNLTSVIEGLVKPGIAGDQISIVAVSGGNATLSGGTVTDMTDASGSQTITYEVSDQYGDTATGRLTVKADPGPKTIVAKVTEDLGTTTNLTAAILAKVTPGIAGDALKIISVNGSATLGSVSLVGGKVEYTASGSGLANIPANGSAADSFTYVVEDQYGDTATGTVDVRVDNPAIVVRGANAAGHNVLTGTGVTTKFVAPGTNNTITTNGGNDIVSDAGGYDTVIATSGDVQVILAGTHNNVTGGSGTLTVTDNSGGYNAIALGSGNALVAIVGSHNVIGAGTGNNTISFVTGDNEVTLNMGGSDSISGMTLAGGDWFNLANLLSEAGLSSSVTNTTQLSNYLETSTSGGNTSLVFNAAGNWSQSGATIATLDGMKASFSQLASTGMFHF